MEKYLAHISEDGREQTVKEHLMGTAALAEKFANSFGSGEWGKLCGLTHDLGKYSAEFQDRIRGSQRRVDHSTKGCQVLINQGALPAAFCVAGHHGGLPDGGENHDTADKPTLFGRYRKQIPKAEGWKSELDIPSTPGLRNMDEIETAFFIRMLYSCLVDADYLDTEAFMLGEEREKPETLPVLLERLNNYLNKKGFLRPVGPINEKRAQVLTACIDAGKQEQGLFSLTVPTGGGKTIASLAFALNHAVKNKMDRIIYVIPYCSIIEQTAEVFKGILGENAVLEHHGNAEFDDNSDEETRTANLKRLKSTENWDSPIIVTTAVQFFESLYSSKSSKCRKLHNIANSVIIFDEAQTLPIDCLEPCVSAIGQLAKGYRTSAVLCTATQPALDEIFERLTPGLKRQELTPDVAGLFNHLKRVTIMQEGIITNSQLAERMMESEQVLCIVNSRKDALEVFSGLKGEGAIHLSTLMHPVHRSALIAEIRKHLKNGQPCRVVATPLIEAGVDVDFPKVFRAQAGLDSILQAAGRCNREGKRSREESLVIVFEPEGGSPRIFSSNISALKEIAEINKELDSPKAIEDYFNSYLSIKGNNLDRYHVLKSFKESIEGKMFPFKYIGEKFVMIEKNTKTIYIPCSENEELIKKLINGFATRIDYQALGRYGVNIYENHFIALMQSGDIELLDENTGILKNDKLYSNETGLSLTADEGKALWI